MERVRIYFFLLAVLLVPAKNLYSIDRLKSTASRSTEFVLFEENGKVGLKDREGEVLIPATYDAIGWSDGKLSIIDKVVGYQLNGLWGLIHTSNKIITPPEFLDLTPGEGSYLVAQKKSQLSQRRAFGIINTSGKVVIPFAYDGLKLANMRAVVMSRSNSKYLFGLADISNRILIPLAYQNIYSLGSLRYAVENGEGKTAIFSDEGTQISDFSIDSISSFRNNHAILYQDQKQGVIDRNGQVILKPTYREVQISSDGNLTARESDEWFLLSGENKIIGRYKADNVQALSAQRYAIVTSGKYQLTDNDFKALHDDYFTFLGKLENGIARFKVESKTGVITSEGKELIPAQYHELIADGDAFRACTDIGYKKRWVLLDRNGNKLSEKHYEDVAPFNGKFYPVKNRGFWGALDESGTEIISCVHDSLIQHSGKNVVVKFKGEYGVVDLNENWRVTPRQNPVQVLNDTTFLELGGKTTFMKAFPDNIIYFSENLLEYDGHHLRERLPSGAYWLIDMTGIIVERSNQPRETEIILPESEGLRAIMKDGKFGFVDQEGRLRIANRYENAKPYSDGLAAIQIRGKWGFIDHQEKLVVQPVYDHVEDFHNGKAIVRQDRVSGIIDPSGKLLLPVRYDEIIPNLHNRFVIRQGKAYGLADASGSIIIQPRYDSVMDPGNGYVIVQRGGKFGVLTLHSVSTIPMIYDDMTFDPHHSHFIAVKRAQWETLPWPAKN